MSFSLGGNDLGLQQGKTSSTGTHGSVLIGFKEQGEGHLVGTISGLSRRVPHAERDGIAIRLPSASRSIGQGIDTVRMETRCGLWAPSTRVIKLLGFAPCT